MVILLNRNFFTFSLRGRAKEWLLSLPRNSIDSWTKCKDAFIGKYYPPTKIISLRSSIMNFKQFDNEHVAQAWERMKSLVKNCPTHGLTTWMFILLILLLRNLWEELMMFLSWLITNMFPLILLSWILNAMLLVLLFWEDPFLEL